jgi:hypothetical protein
VDRGDEATSEGTAQSDGEQTANSSEAQTIILDPVLLTRLAPGAQQPLSVRVYDGDQQPVSGVPVTLHTNGSAGATGITDMTNSAGVAILVVTGLTQSAEYVATSGSAVSNTIRIAAPILP